MLAGKKRDVSAAVDQTRSYCISLRCLLLLSQKLRYHISIKLCPYGLVKGASVYFFKRVVVREVFGTSVLFVNGMVLSMRQGKAFSMLSEDPM